jgi:glycosyltransferase involved in cell wall biosynthesis
MSAFRVLHVAETLVGGIATYLIELLPAQVNELGENCVAILIPEEHTQHLPQMRGVRIYTYPRSGRNIQSLLALYKAIRSVSCVFKPQIIHAHSSFAGATVRTQVFPSGIPRPRLVYSANGWVFLRDVAPWKNTITKWLELLLTLNSDAIINVSRNEQEQTLAAGFPPSKCHMIHNGLSPLEAPSGISLGLDQEKLNFIFIGRFDHQKGIDILLKEFLMLPTEKYALYLAGSSVLNDESSGITGPLPDNITLLGWLPRSTVLAYLPQFDAVIMPSRWEGFSFTALEAMRSGIALITSNRAPFTEVVTDKVTGRFFALEDPGYLGELLSSTSKQTLRQMGEQGRLKFKAEFTSDVMNEKVIALYRELLA